MLVDFGRDESSPMDECDGLLVATYPAENPPTVGRWTVSGTGYAPRFMVDGGRFKLLLNGGVTIIMR